MKIVRVFTGSDGKSHFEEVDIPMVEKSPADWRSIFTKATGIIFRETTPQYDLDYHVAPQRQYVITVKGYVDIVVGDGSSRRFGPGDIMLAEDTTGQGHISRAVNNKPRECIFVTLD